MYKHFQVHKKVCATHRCSLTERTCERFSFERMKITSEGRFTVLGVIVSKENINIWENLEKP